MSVTPPDAESLEKLLKGIKIPPAPAILLKLSNALQKDHPELAEIGKIIQLDASLSGLMLKTVNSPMFGLSNKVNSISHAISLLGIPYTVNIAMGLVLRQTMDQPKNNLPRFWDSPSNIALLAAKITSQILPCSIDEAYLLGLFHNAGHTLINQKSDGYADFLSQNSNHPDFSITQLENERYQFDHATLGYYLAVSWGIPDDLNQIILNHHDVEGFLDETTFFEDKNCQTALMATLKMAEHFDLLHSGVTEDHEWNRIKDLVLGYLGLSEFDYQDLKMELLDCLCTELSS